MEYITTKDASAKWGISPTRITILANEGRIPGAQRLGKSWLIPSNATKPPERKANHSGIVKKEPIDFSFPLYHFRPDWGNIKESQLSKQQQQLLLAENAVMECRFEDAYQILEALLQAPDDIAIEIGCLWNAGLCCFGLNKPKDFFRIYLRFQILLTEDFPYRNDYAIVYDTLKTYIDTIDSAASSNVCYTDIHEQCLPLACMLVGYTHLSQEIINPGSTDTNVLELNLRLLKYTSANIVVALMHCYLLGIYNLHQDTVAAAEHGKRLVQLTFENKIYYPLVTYYRYFESILQPILSQYPEDFQEHCLKLASRYEENYNTFLSSTYESSVFSKLTSADQPYLFAVLMALPNSHIAEKLGVSSRTVKRRFDKLCEKFGVNSKKELKEYLHNYM